VGTAFIDCSSCHAHIEKATNNAFVQTALADVRLQFGDACLQEFAMQKRFAGLARPRLIEIDADRCLKHWRSVHREEYRLGKLLRAVPPAIERLDNLLRDPLLQREERIVR
jgi:hypothetical protein